MSDSGNPGNRLEFETLISDLSSRFINVPAGEVDREQRPYFPMIPRHSRGNSVTGTRNPSSAVRSLSLIVKTGTPTRR